MGYNPDANGDALIGVSDLSGLLALYGQPFNNGDSIVVATVQVSGDNQGWPSNGSHEALVLPDADVIYLDVEAYDTGFDGIYSTYNVFKMKLPDGVGFKTLLVIPPHADQIQAPDGADMDEMFYVEYNFFSDNPHPFSLPFRFDGGGLSGDENDLNRGWYVFMFLRDHQGFWRPLNGLGKYIP